MTPVEPLSNNILCAPQKPSHVIAISSGKGGVGKTSISVNLGLALSRMGRRVCILDADTGLANINILLGLTPRYSLEHVLFGAKSVHEVMLTAPHDLKIIPGANGITECVNLQQRQQLQLTGELAEIEQAFDYLLVDTAAGISETTLDFARAAQQTLLVITPEPTSLTDAFSLLKLLVRRGKKNHFHVVVNMCSSAGQARGVYQRFSTAVNKYIGVRPSYLGYLLQDESLRAAVTMQSPVALFPETDPSCRSFFRLGEALESALQDVAPTASFSSYWQSLYRQRRREDQRPATALEQNAAPEKFQLYLTGLRTRLLTLMAQGRLPASVFDNLLEELRVAMKTHFPDHPPVPAEPSAFASDQPEAAQAFAGHVDTGAGAPVSATRTAQRYDDALFGSQQQLLDQLRSECGLTLIEQLEMIRQKTGNT